MRVIKGNLLCVFMVLPVFMLAVFLESLGSLHILGSVGSYFFLGGWPLRRGMLPAFIKFQIATGDKVLFLI